MWKIGEVKRKGNWAFKKNYWKTVVVAFILSLLVGGGVGSYNFSNNNFNNNNFNNNLQSGQASAGAFSFDGPEDSFDNGFADEFIGEFQEDFGVTPSVPSVGITGTTIATILVFGVVFFIVFAILFTIGILLDVFIVNPVEVGAKGFFLKNLNTNANVKEMLSAFDKGSYKNLVKVMFFKGLYTFLWSLLFIIPGIVKAYEYRMIPFIMAEHPEMPMEQAFYESKRMMTGNKWNAFLLDLSFIGWFILSGLTLGILAIFYVSPYKKSTDAVLYETLRYGNGNIVYTEEPGSVEVN